MVTTLVNHDIKRPPKISDNKDSWYFSCDPYCVKNVKQGVFPGPYFLLFELNTNIYSVHFEYEKIRIRKNSVFGHISGSVTGLIIDNLDKSSQENEVKNRKKKFQYSGLK